MGLDRIIRKVVPSLAMITRNRLLMTPLDVADWLTSLPFKEFRSLPPNRFRLRVGVGRNRLLFNQGHFIRQPLRFWLHAFSTGAVTLESNIVDIGCGCGRYAHTLRDSRLYTGHYTGIDIDREMIDWLTKHYARKHFTFIAPDLHSTVYNPGGRKEPYRLPLDDASQDFVFSTSLFTHLLEEEMLQYGSEAARVLGPGRAMHMTVFCLEHVDKKMGDRWTFEHTMGNAKVENPQYPEAAVAYAHDFLVGAFGEVGFSHVEVLRRPANQSLLVCRK